MKLHAERGRPRLERLRREDVALGEQRRAARQFDALAMPLVDMVRPRRAKLAAGLGRAQRVVADLGHPFGMERHPAAELARQHLRAEADAEERLALLERHRHPVDLVLDELGLVVGAHRPAEHHDTAMFRQRLGQPFAERRTAHVKRIAARGQMMADAPRRGHFLVQDDQDRLARDWIFHGANQQFMGRLLQHIADLYPRNPACNPFARAGPCIRQHPRLRFRAVNSA